MYSHTNLISRAMHTTLLSITSQSLAFENLKRLDQFPKDLIDREILDRAVARTHETDAQVGESMKELHMAFKEVMRHAPQASTAAVGGAGAGEGIIERRGSGSGSLTSKLEERQRIDRERDLNKRIRDKVDYEDLASVRKRVVELERRLEEGIQTRNSYSDPHQPQPQDLKGKGKAREREREPPPPPSSLLQHAPNDRDDIPAPPPIDHDGNGNGNAFGNWTENENENLGITPEVKEPGKAGKRSRARALLDDMLTRLEKVESMKGALEDRYTALEDQVNSREQEDIEIERMGNGRWRIIEELRDPDGVIRGKNLKRKRHYIEAGAGAGEMVVSVRGQQNEEGTTLALTDVETKDVTMSENLTTLALEPTLNGNGSEAMVQGLKEQVESLKKELQDLKSGQEERDKEIAAKVTATLRDEMKSSIHAVRPQSRFPNLDSPHRQNSNLKPPVVYIHHTTPRPVDGMELTGL